MQALKTILPITIRDHITKAKNRVDLSRTPALPFDTKNLATADKLNREKFFNAPETNTEYEQAHTLIAGIFGDNDKIGGVNPGDRRALFHLIHHFKPQTVLEVGTHIGASTLYIAAALKPHGGTVDTVDIYDVNADNAAWHNIGLTMPPKDMAAKADLNTLIRFHSRGSLDFMQNTEQKFDFIFLDGDHSAVTVYKETAAALSRLAPGGMILLHDYYPDGKALFPDGRKISGPYLALERIKSEQPDIKVLPLGNLPWETKQGLKRTSLALLMAT